MRDIVIGDVHGCLEELDELLRTVEYRPTDRLVFVGDLVDRGRIAQYADWRSASE